MLQAKRFWKNVMYFLHHFFGPFFKCLIDQLSFGLQKKHLCDRQLFKPVNDDDPEFKNKLQLNIVKADIKTRDDIVKLNKAHENNGICTVSSKFME